MFTRSLFACFFLLLWLPATAHAAVNPYYAQQESRREGSEIVRFTAAARFVHERIYPAPSQEQAYLCSVSRLLPEQRGAGFLRLAARRVSELSGVPEQRVLILLTSHPCPGHHDEPVRSVRSFRPMRIDGLGRVLSLNPVWNACVRNTPLTVEMLRSNPDVVLHRQGQVRVFIPLSCRDYHRGPDGVWTFPDDASVSLVLDARGRLLGDAPPGYILVTQ